MALLISRQGYTGLAIEAVPGTAESTPSVFIPFIENSMQEKHEKLFDISSRATRVRDYDARNGKKWGEGDLGAYVDSNNIGYFLKLALGAETLTTVGGTPTVVDHHFTVTASGNTPKTATLWNARGSNPTVKRHTYSALDTLELEITNEDIGELTAAFITDFPTSVAAPALTVTSGTLLAWNNMAVRFGADLTTALAADPTKLTNFKLEIANNVEAHYRSGSDQPDVIASGEMETTGEYTLFFESDTELDAYRTADKRVMVVDLSGANIGNGYQERVRLVFHAIVIEEAEFEADLDEVFALTNTFRCVHAQSSGRGYFDATVRNLKTTAY